MIVITLAGESSRFFNEGFDLVKYKLPYGDSTIIENILSFMPREEKLLIILNKKFKDRAFMESLLHRLAFREFEIVEIYSSRGQLESVYLGLINSDLFWNSKDYLTIFNGDTIRKSNIWYYENCDGLLEVFIADGDHWSFVDNVQNVSLVSEKVRISPYCSSGLYFFKSVALFLDNYLNYIGQFNEEYFIAPYYNLLIKKGFNISCSLVQCDSFVFCGTPVEYNNSTSLLNSKN